MATSDSEDFESADEWEEEDKGYLKDDARTEISMSKFDKFNQNNKVIKEVLYPDSSAKVVSTGDLLQSDVGKLSISVIDGGKNTCYGDITAESNFCVNSKIRDATQSQIDKASEESSKLSLGKDKCEMTSVEEVRTSVVETDGWDCEDEEIDELIEDNSKGNVESLLDRLSDSVKQEQSSGGRSGSWSGWGSWGVTSILSTATESVSTLTNQVSQGFSTVLETGLGAPNPEELIKQEMAEEKKIASLDENSKANETLEESASLFGLGRVISGVSSITKLVETASTKVVSGSLDTLETIGKKTMEVLQEGDPGLRKKRAIFSENIVLSQLLREAKEKAEEEDRAFKTTQEARRVHFETLFDDYHGLVHLEALEMLSKQSSIKLQSILLSVPSTEMSEYQESLLEIKEICHKCEEDEIEGVTFEDLKSNLAAIGKGLGVPVANEKFMKTWEEIYQWIKHLDRKQINLTEIDDQSPAPSAQEIYHKAIDTLARLTAECVEQFHKIAELLLVYEERNPKQEAKILLDMASIFSLQVSTAATVFSQHLNTTSEIADYPESVNSHITNIFLEANNSSSYIQEAFQLLVPVLQVGLSLS